MLMSQMSLDKHRSQQETMHTNLKGQALVITLLVLAIVSIVVIGILIIANRDVSQVINNEKYERLYNEAERIVRDTIQLNGVATLPSSCGNSSLFPGYLEYNCGTTQVTSDDLTAVVDLKVLDRRSIEDFPIAKDRSLDVALDGYSQGVEVTWTGNIAMEFNIIYTDGGGNIQSIKDIYDRAGVFDSLAGDNPTNDINNIHDINFQVLDAGNTTSSTTFTISSTNGISLGTTIALRLTPRSKIEGDTTSLTVRGTNVGAFPYQMREFVSTAVDQVDASSPLARVLSKVPLAPQLDSIFDYSLLVKTDLIQ